MMKVKICGIKREDEVEVINQFPVSYAGFIFAKSKRQVDKDQCIRLSSLLRTDIKKVGVFVNEPIESLLNIIRTCNLDVVQLHGDEPVDYVQKIPVPVWKTIPVKDKSSLERAEDYAEYVEGILFETYHETLRGGTGETFDWQIFNSSDMSEVKSAYLKILAGGINPENAGKAKAIVSPDVLDVNSGVEVEGFKTFELINKLFEAIGKIE